MPGASPEPTCAPREWPPPNCFPDRALHLQKRVPSLRLAGSVRQDLHTAFHSPRLAASPTSNPLRARIRRPIGHRALAGIPLQNQNSKRSGRLQAPLGRLELRMPPARELDRPILRARLTKSASPGTPLPDAARVHAPASACLPRCPRNPAPTPAFDLPHPPVSQGLRRQHRLGIRAVRFLDHATRFLRDLLQQRQQRLHDLRLGVCFQRRAARLPGRVAAQPMLLRRGM